MKEEIVRELLKHGILATPDVLKKIEEEGLQNFLSQVKKDDSVFLTLDKNTPQNKGDVIVDITVPEKPKKLSPTDFIKYYNNRYEGLKNILLSKTTALSINKLSGFSEVSVIGMVRELLPDGFVLEDTTGKIDVVSKKKPSIDDVINVKGLLKENKIIEKEILYPDIPLNREIDAPKGMRLILTHNTNKEKLKNIKHDLVFSLTGEGDGKRIFTLNTSPARIKIKKNGKAYSILFYKPKKHPEPKDAKAMLKRRHLSPTRDEITGPDDVFIIKEIPNCLWLAGKDEWSEVYKGVLIVCTSEKGFAVIDVETGGVEFHK